MKYIKKNSVFALSVCLMMIMCFGSIFTGCNHVNQTKKDGIKNIVTTTTMLYDLVSVIGADKVEVTALMGAGIDPHLYQASSGDVSKMQKADIVVYNGLHLEGKMAEVFASLEEQGKSIICIEEGLKTASLLADVENPEIHDPHIWFDVSLWKEAAKYVESCLSEIDSENAEVYMKNLDDYLVELEELEQYVNARVSEVSENQRILITAHDAFRYFGNAYDFEVKGLQGISTASEAGTADVSQLASFIAEHQIKAVFVESSVSPKNIQALKEAVSARGFEVEIGGQLYSDSLGDAASKHDTYITTFKENIDTIVDALK